MTASLVKFNDVGTTLAGCTLCGDMTRRELDTSMLGRLPGDEGGGPARGDVVKRWGSQRCGRVS